MRRICRRFATGFGPGLFLAIVATVSIGLNVDLGAVPRFDGAGYAVLGEALATGHGYREINKPDAPPHDHFPPGYPIVLGVLWQFTGRSVVAAHVLSIVCTVTAVLLSWRWFRVMYPPEVAVLLGLTLAINWTWARIGGSIQSEPLFILWELLAVHAAIQAERCDALGFGFVLGLVLAGSMLTRHIGICITCAVVLNLAWCGRWKSLTAAASTAGLLMVPWVSWLTGIRHHTQLGLLTINGVETRVIGQALFYIQRFPDQVAGPLVEVGTVLRQSLPLWIAANLWAMMVFAVMVWGWVQTVQTPRRRLVGLIGLFTFMALLIWPFTEAGRFLIPLLPLVLVGLTEGLAHLIRLLGMRTPRVWAVMILLGVSIPYSAYSVMSKRAESQRRQYTDFDAACVWIAHHDIGVGPVLTRHPGEVFWQIRHPTIEPDSSDPEAIGRLIDRLGVTYLLIDEERYLNAGSNPLNEYVRRYRDRVMLVWAESHGERAVQVFKVIPSK